jgi:putative colanic acid biosynthesis acetyltransferase WcaF
MRQTDLSTYNNSWFRPGGNALKRVLWYYMNILFVKGSLFPFSGFKIFWLRLFGGKIGKNVTIKPGVNIKYPWNLTIGSNVWLGENVWIDCLAQVIIRNNVCISQGAVILTGSHNYKKISFDLIVLDVTLEDGVWIGAGAIVNAGVTAATHVVLTSGSVATKNMEAYTIYQGNPAIKTRLRVIEQAFL